MRKPELLLFVIPAVLLIAVAAWLTAKSSRLAPPHTIRITSGAEGSSYRRFADKYKASIERYGVKVEVIPSAGAIENLRRLADRSMNVDVGFVQGGVKEGIDVSGLVSLGSLAEQPLIVYYRAPQPVERLSELRGQRLAIGAPGSGTRALAMKLLGASNMTGPPTTLIELAGDKAAAALIAEEVDAIFIVGDAATPALMQKMRATPGIRLMSFRQAEAYTRKFQFLSKLTLPEGALDLEHDYPAEPVQLVGPTVELVARDTLHPALSDLLIAAAREVHGTPGLFRNAGEFPAPLARDFPLSRNAERYYKSGEQFLYKWLPFWLASLLDRLLVVLVPLIVAVVPITRLLPALYRWRIRSRIYRWYGALMRIEHDIQVQESPEQRAALVARLDDIARAVRELRTPASFGDQLYVLRDHVAAVRRRAHQSPTEAVAS
ncbi:MAG TPA: TAXI family TRAP transporter solute-binding subunit [Polyangia bacterium]|nr:TAXI family TRAP transporter solute-binding subunit [Polyangia bacterium]